MDKEVSNGSEDVEPMEVDYLTLAQVIYISFLVKRTAL